MIRLFLEPDLLAGAVVAVNPEQAHYLTRVMRLSAGSELAVFNGRDGEWLARVVDGSARRCGVQVLERLRPQKPTLDLELIIAMVKRPRLETIIEKATELGARRVRLALTERTNTDRANLTRLAAISTEAAEQTGRLDLLEILPPLQLGEIIAAWERGRRLLFCDETAGAPTAAAALAGAPGGAWGVLIGPEGGFSAGEGDLIRTLPETLRVSLGPRILRADTAAIAALTLWQSHLGDWRGP